MSIRQSSSRSDRRWIADGSPSAAHWIADRLDVCAATAREWIRVGRALSGLDATVDAFEQGRLTFAKVRAITRIATPDNEAELLRIAETTPPSSIAKALAVWSIRNEPSDIVEARQYASRSVRWRNEPDGTVTATMRFMPLAAGTIQAAIDTQNDANTTQTSTRRDMANRHKPPSRRTAGLTGQRNDL